MYQTGRLCKGVHDTTYIQPVDCFIYSYLHLVCVDLQKLESELLYGPLWILSDLFALHGSH